jgi:hypothetical protein
MPVQHHKSFITGFVCFIGLISFIGMTYGADPMLSEVQGLLQGMETLKQDLQKADETKAALDKEKVALIQTRELLIEAEKNYEKDATQWQKEWNEWRAEAARHNAEIGKSDDPEWVKAFNEEADRDNATIWAPLKDREKTLDERKKIIDERTEGLNPAVDEWARKVKENNARLNELQAKYGFQIKMIRGLTTLPAGRMLIQKSGASEECANIPGIENLEKQLGGAAERAHRCLQKIWDGAR